MCPHMDDASGHVESINAVTLVTADMAASTAFYRALGFELVVGGADAAFTTYRVGPGFLNVQLDAAHAPIPAIWGRVIFWVDDVDAVYARATEAGFAPTTAPADAPWGERYFHLHDPDGHELSFARLL
jgi:catechol 2,3-dioxygenase-like lactoylglutathione lyase family enzyme